LKNSALPLAKTSAKTSSTRSANLSHYSSKMNSCGVFIFNAPFQLEDKIANFLDKICQKN